MQPARKSQLQQKRAFIDMHEGSPWDKQMFMRAKLERQREQGWGEGLASMPHKMTKYNCQSLLCNPLMSRGATTKLIRLFKAHGASFTLSLFLHYLSMSLCGPSVKFETIEEGL